MIQKKLFDIRRPISRISKLILLICVASLILGIWFMLAEYSSIPPIILPKLGSVLKAFKILFLEHDLLINIFWSFIRILAGFSLAIIVALPLGIMMGSFPVIKNAIIPFSEPLRYLPIAALVPLFIIWFGMGELMKILLLFVGIVVYLLPLIVEAIEDVDEVYLETAYTLKASRWQIIRHVLIPGASPLIFEAFRIMNGIGWTYLILAEILNANYGLGHLIIIAEKRSRTDWIFAGIIIILLIGFLSDRLIAKFNEKKFAWKGTTRKKL